MQVSNLQKLLPALMDLQAANVSHFGLSQLLRAEGHLRFFTDSESPNWSYAHGHSNILHMSISMRDINVNYAQIVRFKIQTIC